MGRMLPILFLINIALLIIALIDCLSTDESKIRALPKVIWVFLILLFPVVGPIVWFVAGRPQKNAQPRTGVWAPGGGFPESNRPRRQVAPDDDPEFLRNIRASRKEDEDLLRQWEEDLRKREDDLRKRDGREETPDA
jgi:hypothetical protein